VTTIKREHGILAGETRGVVPVAIRRGRLNRERSKAR
jgi:hypothetical protein